MIRCPKCKSGLSVPATDSSELVVECPRCRTEVELYAGPAAGSESMVESTAELGQTNAIRSEPSDHKSKFVRRRYYSRTRLPKKLAAKAPRRHRKRKTHLTKIDFVKIVLGGLMAFP